MYLFTDYGRIITRSISLHPRTISQSQVMQNHVKGIHSDKIWADIATKNALKYLTIYLANLPNRHTIWNIWKKNHLSLGVRSPCSKLYGCNLHVKMSLGCKNSPHSNFRSYLQIYCLPNPQRTPSPNTHLPILINEAWATKKSRLLTTNSDCWCTMGHFAQKWSQLRSFKF